MLLHQVVKGGGINHKGKTNWRTFKIIHECCSIITTLACVNVKNELKRKRNFVFNCNGKLVML